MSDDRNDSMPLREKAIVTILGKIPELKGFSGPQIVRIGKIDVTQYGPDEWVIREGADKLDQLMIILTGSVSIRKKVGGENELDVYEQVAEIPGPAVIGENSFFTGLPRSAAVYAKDRIAVINLTRKDMMRLVSLDKFAYVSYLSRTAKENLDRAERTLVYYMGTLQLALKQASISKSVFFATLARLKSEVKELKDDAKRWESLVKDILLFIRDLNMALEELYQFAQLPDLSIIQVDPMQFQVRGGHHFFDILRSLVGELSMMQELVPLSAVNFKDALITHILNMEDSKSDITNYQKVISLAIQVYWDIAEWHQDMGITAKVASLDKYRSVPDNSPLKKLLWDEI
jgi:CRP-like cAMP-binding protein